MMSVIAEGSIRVPNAFLNALASSLSYGVSRARALQGTCYGSSATNRSGLHRISKLACLSKQRAARSV